MEYTDSNLKNKVTFIKIKLQSLTLVFSHHRSQIAATIDSFSIVGNDCSFLMNNVEKMSILNEFCVHGSLVLLIGFHNQPFRFL